MPTRTLLQQQNNFFLLNYIQSAHHHGHTDSSRDEVVKPLPGSAGPSPQAKNPSEDNDNPIGVSLSTTAFTPIKVLYEYTVKRKYMPLVITIILCCSGLSFLPLHKNNPRDRPVPCPPLYSNRAATKPSWQLVVFTWFPIRKQDTSVPLKNLAKTTSVLGI